MATKTVFQSREKVPLKQYHIILNILMLADAFTLTGLFLLEKITMFYIKNVTQLVLYIVAVLYDKIIKKATAENLFYS